MKAGSLIVAMFFISGCAHEDPWTTRDTVGQVVLSAALVADAYSTSNIQNVSGVWENGPIASHVLGQQPSTSDTWQYFTTLAISHYFISRALPAKWRPYWQYGNATFHAVWVRKNCLDLKLC